MSETHQTDSIRHMARATTKPSREIANAQAAMRYLARGWSVLPLRGGDKRPLVQWEKLQQQRADAAAAAQWFARWPDANVGIVTGEISNLIVLDVDPKHGGDDSLAELERRFGKLPDTVEAETGGGGRHLYFAHPGDLVPNRAGLAQGIDLRGDGGYVVAPPSRHPSGQLYAWAPGRSPDESALAALPRWLLFAGRGFGGFGPRARRSLTGWRSLVREGVAEGERNSTVASLTGHLLWHGVDPEVALELMLAWNRLRCRPPLDDDEVARAVASIAKLHEKGSTE
jgi:hypothetical protein